MILVCPCILDVETTCNIFRFGRQMRSPEPTSTHCSDVLPGDQPCCTWDAIKSPTIASISNPTVLQSTNIISLQIYIYICIYIYYISIYIINYFLSLYIHIQRYIYIYTYEHQIPTTLLIILFSSQHPNHPLHSSVLGTLFAGRAQKKVSLMDMASHPPRLDTFGIFWYDMMLPNLQKRESVLRKQARTK